MKPVSILIVLLLAFRSLLADTVVMDNGSRIVGQVVRLADGKLTVKTEFAGDLTIDAGDVASVVTDGPVNVQFADGERMQGPLTEDGPADLSIVAEEGEARTAPLSDVAGIWQPEALPPVSVAREGELPPAWSFLLEMGVSGQTGNSETTSAIGRIEANRKTQRDRLKLYGLARYASEDGNETAQEFIGGARYEYDITERCWFAYARIEAENDKLEDLDLRLLNTAGIGAFLIRQEKQELKVRGGLGYEYNLYTDDTDECNFIGEAGYEYGLQVNSRLRLTHALDYYPTFVDVGDYRLVVENAATIDLNDSKTWRLRLGTRHQYDAMPQPGVERLDNYYFANLVWETR